MPSSSPNRFLLLYGSQTGQAKAIAEEICERSSQFGLTAEVHCLSMTDKKFGLEKESCVVLVTSTTGDGEPPETAQKFVRRLNKTTLPDDYLVHLNYAILGLGDSNYTNFCNNAKNIDRRLNQLGAQRFYPSGFADEAVGLEVVVDPWIEGLFPALQIFLGISPSIAPILNVTSVSAGAIRTKEISESSLSYTKLTKNQLNIPCETSDLLIEDDVVSRYPKVVKSLEADSFMLNGARDTNLLVLGTSSTDNDAIKMNNSNNIRLSETEINSVHNKDLNEKGFSSDLLEAGTQTKMEKDAFILTSYSSVDGDPTASSLSLQKERTTQDSESGTEHGRQEFNDTREACLETFASKAVSRSIMQPSLRWSVPPLSESNVTLPVMMPAFLTSTFSPADEDFITKLAQVPWQNGYKLPSSASGILKAKVVSATRLSTADAKKKTLLLRLNIEKSDLQYCPGDAISIICTNTDQEVNQLISRLGLESQADLPFQLSVMADTLKKRAAVPPFIPSVVTLRYIFKNCFDIREPPKKALLRVLVEYTSDPYEKRRLQELCSKEGAEDYSLFIRSENVSLLDLLYTFPTCQPPVERLLEHLSRLQPRPYSACSSHEWNPGHLDIAFNVLEIPASLNRVCARRGLCTGWLDDITHRLQNASSDNTGDVDSELGTKMEAASLQDIEIPIFKRTNQTFRHPSDLTIPIIMIGPGTGVAPFIGFLQERQLQRQKLTDLSLYGETWLLFGCRNKDKDFLFRSAIEEFLKSGTLTKFLLSLSQDNMDVVCAKYVQHSIHSYAADLVKLLDEKGAIVYVCGDARNMAKDVNAAFETVLQEQKGLSIEDAKTYLMKMRVHHRYLEDVWA